MQTHKYTNTQIHKHKNTKSEIVKRFPKSLQFEQVTIRNTLIQMHKYANTQIHKYTNTQKHKTNIKTQIQRL